MDWKAWEAALPWIVALGGGTGIGAGLKTLVDVLVALRKGVSAKEGKRRQDIVQARLAAEEEAAAERRRANYEMARADWAEENMRVYSANAWRAKEHATELRVLLLEQAHLTRAELPPWPEMDVTRPRPQNQPSKE